jgi:hypothetical protein
MRDLDTLGREGPRLLAIGIEADGQEAGSLQLAHHGGHLVIGRTWAGVHAASSA